MLDAASPPAGDDRFKIKFHAARLSSLMLRNAISKLVSSWSVRWRPDCGDAGWRQEHGQEAGAVDLRHTNEPGASSPRADALGSASCVVHGTATEGPRRLGRLGGSHTRSTQPPLSGWNSWAFLGGQVSGKDVLAVVDATLKMPDRLRPQVIQIDGGYEDFTGGGNPMTGFPKVWHFMRTKSLPPVRVRD